MDSVILMGSIQLEIFYDSMQSTFPHIHYTENLEQPNPFLTEVSEVLRMNLNLEDLIVRINPTFLG